jgi:hypothetical protein
MKKSYQEHCKNITQEFRDDIIFESDLFGANTLFG